MKKAWSEAKIEALDIMNTQGPGYKPGNGHGHGVGNGHGHGHGHGNGLVGFPGFPGDGGFGPGIGTEPSFS